MNKIIVKCYNRRTVIDIMLMKNKSLDGIKKISELKPEIKIRQKVQKKPGSGKILSSSFRRASFDGLVAGNKTEFYLSALAHGRAGVKEDKQETSVKKKTKTVSRLTAKKQTRPGKKTSALFLLRKLIWPTKFWLKIPANFSFSTVNLKLVWRRLYQEQRVPVMVVVLALFLAFAGGAWMELSTPKIQADDKSEQTSTKNFQVAMPNAQVQTKAAAVSNDVLFNTPMEYLKNYLASVAEPDIIAYRKNQLAEYLKEKKSPLVTAAETIAEQPHWQLILAIAFAESTLGKNCMDNNCSNIGSRPGALYWRSYPSYQSWVVDFNRLLNNKRYKNMTLEQMCGVYVQPCNPNWLMATSQILGELKDRGIN